jgi:hypothetical protein
MVSDLVLLPRFLTHFVKQRVQFAVAHSAGLDLLAERFKDFVKCWLSCQTSLEGLLSDELYILPSLLCQL